MLVRVERKAFVEMAEKARRAITKSPMPILGCLRIDVQPEGFSGIRITGTSTSMTVVSEVSCLSVDEPFTFIVEAASLLAAVSRMQAPEISMEKKQGVVRIKGGRIKLDLPCYAEEEWPAAREFQPDYSGELEFLPDMVQEVSHAISGVGANRMMNSFHVECGPGIRVTGLDGHRIAIRENMEGNADASFICEGKLLKEACKLLDGTIQFQLQKGKLLEFSGKDLTIQILLEGGAYFNIERMISTPLVYKMKVNRLEFLNSIELALTIDQLLILTVQEDHIHLQCKKPVGDIETDLPVELTSDAKFQGFRIGMNGTFLADALKNIKEDFVFLEMSNSKAPVVIRGVGYYEMMLPIQIAAKKTA